MRRSLLLGGITAVTIALLGSGAAVYANTKSQRLQRHMAHVQELAFCARGYEIASGFPGYRAHKSLDPRLRDQLNQRSQALSDRSEALGAMLRDSLRDRAIDLGMDEESYDEALARFQVQGEQDAVIALQRAQEPSEFLDQLNEICEDHVK